VRIRAIDPTEDAVLHEDVVWEDRVLCLLKLSEHESSEVLN
jgi:hypothetical protein